MSTTPMPDAKDYQPDMNNYAQPHYPPSPGGTRSRNSSHASRYVPDNYPAQPSPGMPNGHSHLAPVPQDQSGGAYTPSNPEQYRPPPAAFSGTVPPAQLGPYYHQDDRPMASDGYDIPSSRRRASAASHYSERSRRSSHSHGHRDDSHRHHDHEHHHHDHEPHEHHHHHHDDDDHHSSHKKKKHFEDDAENELYLKRRNTPGRSYGASLFALFDSIKDALKGN